MADLSLTLIQAAMGRNELSAADRRPTMHPAQTQSQRQHQHIPHGAVVPGHPVVSAASHPSRIRACPAQAALQVAPAPQPAAGILLATTEHMPPHAQVNNTHSSVTLKRYLNIFSALCRLSYHSCGVILLMT